MLAFVISDDFGRQSSCSNSDSLEVVSGLLGAAHDAVGSEGSNSNHSSTKANIAGGAGLTCSSWLAHESNIAVRNSVINFLLSSLLILADLGTIIESASHCELRDIC